MKVPMVTVAGLLVVTFAFWLDDAEAQHGKGRVAPAPLPKAVARPKVLTPHPPEPKAKAQPKPKAKAQPKAKAASKPAQKKEKRPEFVKAIEDEKKKHTAKAKAKTPEHAKKAEKKSKTAGDGPDHESIPLLRSAHQRLHEADHDYDGHRRQASEHVGAALRHLGSFEELQFRSGTGRSNLPQSVSDDHLRQARASLETIRNRLANHKGPTAAHHEAHRAVDAAIREIDLALRVR